MEVTIPKSKYRPQGSQRALLEFADGSMDTDTSINIGELVVPTFTVDGEKNVLVHHLAKVWNFPLSYQLIAKLVKRSPLTLDDFAQTTPELNEQLVAHKLLKKKQQAPQWYYIPLTKIYGAITNSEVFTTNPSGRSEDTEAPPLPSGPTKELKVEVVTAAQVFPGLVTPIKPTFANYNCFTELSKLQFYKERGLYKFIPPSKMVSFNDRELVLQDNPGLYDNPDLDAVLDQSIGVDSLSPALVTRRKKRENLGIDPNSLDFTELVLMGQGYFHEFNVGHLCKVAAYYPEKPSKFGPKLPLPQNGTDTDTPTSKQLQQLAIDTGDRDTLLKYFYLRANRGPSSAYKDQSVVTRITKIPMLVRPVKRTHRVAKPPANRANQNIKGLVHPRYNKAAVEAKLASHQDYVADFLNIEHLHNLLQFNVLLNLYREVQRQTMELYYRFKKIDFEQIYAMKVYRDEFESRKAYAKQVEEWRQKEQARINRDRAEQERVQRFNYEVSRRRHERMRQQFDAALDGPEFQEQRFVPLLPTPPPKPLHSLHLEILNKFTMPLVFPEIVHTLPADKRDDQGPNPDVKRPVLYVVTVPDLHNPELASRVEIVKIPNPNEFAWDNFRKFRSQM